MKNNRLFIENDSGVSEVDRHLLSRIVGKEYSKYITIEVCDAAEKDNRKKLWEAICSSQQIWIASSFVGESGLLFTDLLIRACDENLQNKIVFNLHDRDAGWYIMPHQRALLSYLSINNGFQMHFGRTEIKRVLFPEKTTKKN